MMINITSIYPYFLNGNPCCSFQISSVANPKMAVVITFAQSYLHLGLSVTVGRATN